MELSLGVEAMQVSHNNIAQVADAVEDDRDRGGVHGLGLTRQMGNVESIPAIVAG